MTLLATVVFFRPTVMRTKIEEDADYAAVPALRHAATGLTVATVALLLTGVGGSGALAARLVAAAGLAVYAAGATVVCSGVLRAGRRARPSAHARLLQAACAWFVLAVWADVLVVASGQLHLLDALGVLLLVGVLGQAILGALGYLAPMVRGTDAASRAAIRQRLEALAGLRPVALNLGVALVVVAAMLGAPGGTPGAVVACQRLAARHGSRRGPDGTDDVAIAGRLDRGGHHEEGAGVRVAVFSTKPYDREYLARANDAHGHELVFLEPRLSVETAPLASGFDAVCAFVNDDVGADVIAVLTEQSVRLVALRSAGFNHVDLAVAGKRGLTVVRVPAYSPHAVAEHTVALILTLNRKIHRAHARVREGNFSLVGLLGFDLCGKTVGIVGTGNIGGVFARIMAGFGCRLLAFDPYRNDECLALGVQYVSRAGLFAEADIISLHCPLTPETYHLVDADALTQMREGVMLINTSRGALVDTGAVVDALKRGRIGALGLDVYEEEEALFFQDLSDRVITDDVFARLQTFPNVVITGHQAFFTAEALAHIAATTLENISAFERGHGELHQVTAERVE